MFPSLLVSLSVMLLRLFPSAFFVPATCLEFLFSVRTHLPVSLFISLKYPHCTNLPLCVSAFGSLLPVIVTVWTYQNMDTADQLHRSWPFTGEGFNVSKDTFLDVEFAFIKLLPLLRHDPKLIKQDSLFQVKIPLQPWSMSCFSWDCHLTHLSSKASWLPVS